MVSGSFIAFVSGRLLVGFLGGGSNTYQTTQQIVVGTTAQSQITHMLDEYLLGHFRGAVQDDVLVLESADLLQRVQELDGHADIRDAFDQLHLEGLVAGPQALVYLL